MGRGLSRGPRIFKDRAAIRFTEVRLARQGPVNFMEPISKPIFSVILNQPRELKLGKNHPLCQRGELIGITLKIPL